MKKTILFLLLGLSSVFSTSLFGQIPKIIFNDDIDKTPYEGKNFTSTKLPIEKRVGTYHFGESEDEWNMKISKHKDSVTVEIKYDVWKKNTRTNKVEAVHKTKSYTVKCESNIFYFEKYKGVFAEYNEGNETAKVVLLNGNPKQNLVYQKDKAQIGWYIQ